MTAGAALRRAPAHHVTCSRKLYRSPLNSTGSGSLGGSMGTRVPCVPDAHGLTTDTFSLPAWFQWLRTSWPAGYSGVVNSGSRKRTLTVKVYSPALNVSPFMVRSRKVSSRLSDSPGASSMGCRYALHPRGVSSELHVGEPDASGRVYARTINGQLPTESRTGLSPLFATKARARTRSGASLSSAMEPVTLTPCARIGFTAGTGDCCLTWCMQPREAASKASGAPVRMRK
jgi:hypothetical protein